jgi:hypothetical protein
VGEGNGCWSTTVIRLSAKDGCSARARAVDRPKTPDPTITIDLGIVQAGGFPPDSILS